MEVMSKCLLISAESMYANSQFTETLSICHFWPLQQGMLTIILNVKMINFALNHSAKDIALIRKIPSYSANHYAFGIMSVSFLIKMSVKKVFPALLL